ncbi:MAG: RNA polymerase-binding protein DksA [Haliangiales bacterium]
MKQASNDPTQAPKGAQDKASSSAPELRADPDAGLTHKQLRTFYDKLCAEADRLSTEIKRNIQEAVTEAERHSDEGDQASQNANQAYLLRYADKQNKLLQQVRRALHKLQTGEYGVCEGSGEPIGVQRLTLRPWTRYSVEYKEQLDRERKRR